MIRLTLTLLLVTTLGYAASNHRQDQMTLQQLKFSVGNLRNEIDNHESEILMFGQRLNNQETTLELLREEIQSKKNDPGVYAVEGKVSALIGDIQKIEEPCK